MSCHFLKEIENSFADAPVVEAISRCRLRNDRLTVLGSVAPIPIRCIRTEDSLRNKALNLETLAAAKSALTVEIAPIDDLRSTRDYRLRVSLNLLEDFVRQL